MSKPTIEDILAPKLEVRPRIYAYSIADNAHEGLLKIGQTTRDVKQRVKLEAVRLIRDRGVSYAKATEDLGIHPTQLRSWVKQLADDPQQAFPGHGQMKPEQLEIAQLKREVAKLKAERDKKPRPTSRRNRREVWFCCEAPGGLAGGLVVRGARCLAGWVLCLADTTAQSAQPERRRAWREGSCQFPGERPDLWRQAGVARHAGGGCVVWTASD